MRSTIPPSRISWFGLLALGLAVGCAQGAGVDVATNEHHAGSPLEQTCTSGATAGCNVPDIDGCAAGIRHCSDDGSWGACQPALPAAETCGDGVDNDCNGTVDDACMSGGSGAGGGGGSGGSGASGAGGTTGGQPCTPGQLVSCTTSCGTVGDADCRQDGSPDECVPPQEKCGNGKDDDCDGKVDEDCGQTFDCRDLQPHECNGDLGYGDHCDAVDNEANCPWDWFQAWCHRRDEANGGGQKWDDTVKKWVEDRCDGPVSMSGNTFQCTDSGGKTWVCDTPLVLSFDVARVELGQASGSFDLALAGASFGSDWPTAQTPWLALDRDGSGRIDDGGELFGSGTSLRDGTRAENGFQALAELDDDGDGQITASDYAFASLRLWADENRDRVSQPGELEPLSARGVTHIGLGYERAPRCDARGNCEVERASFDFAEGRRGAIIDVHLARR